MSNDNLVEEAMAVNDSDFLKSATKKAAKSVFSSNFVLKWITGTELNTEIHLSAGTLYEYTVMCISENHSDSNYNDYICSLIIGTPNNLTKFSLWLVRLNKERNNDKVKLKDLKQIPSSVIASTNSKNYTSMANISFEYKSKDTIVPMIDGNRLTKLLVASTYNPEIEWFDVYKKINFGEQNKESKPNKKNLCIVNNQNIKLSTEEYSLVTRLEINLKVKSILNKCFESFNTKPKIILLNFSGKYQSADDKTECVFTTNYYYAIFLLNERSNSKGLNGSTILDITNSAQRLKGFHNFLVDTALRNIKETSRALKKKKVNKNILDKIQRCKKSKPKGV